MTHRTSQRNASSKPTGKGAGKIREVILGKNSLNLPLAIAAMAILVGSFSVLIYNEVSEEDTDTLTVNGNEYTWAEVFDSFEMMNLDDHEGVMLSDLVNDTGLIDPEGHEYRIIAADGYIKTVTWEDMQNGIVRENKETYFSELPKQFYVKDVVEIEVK